jgi:hypothetical protein
MGVRMGFTSHQMDAYICVIGRSRTLVLEDVVDDCFAYCNIGIHRRRYWWESRAELCRDFG